jgi:hypothetical protein
VPASLDLGSATVAVLPSRLDARAADGKCGEPASLHSSLFLFLSIDGHIRNVTLSSNLTLAQNYRSPFLGVKSISESPVSDEVKHLRRFQSKWTSSS